MLDLAVLFGKGVGLSQGGKGVLVELLGQLDLGPVEVVLVGVVEFDFVLEGLDVGDGLGVVGGAGQQVGQQVGVLIFTCLL